eukprot:645817_1
MKIFGKEIPNWALGAIVVLILGGGAALFFSVYPTGAKPAQPTITTVTPGDLKLTIRFTRLTTDGGHPIDNYTLETTADKHVLTPTGSSFEIPGLINGQLYQYRLKAHNAMGASPPAVISDTPGAKPGKPTITTITSGDQKLTIDFAPPTSDGGHSIDNYTLETTTDKHVLTPTESPFEITGLNNSQLYEYHLKAHNAMGDSIPSVITGTPVAPPIFCNDYTKPN